MLDGPELQQVVNLIKSLASDVYKGQGAPTQTPVKVGDIYMDETQGAPGAYLSINDPLAPYDIIWVQFL